MVFTIFDILNFGLVVFLWWFTFKNYKILPQRIPIHFDVEGKADNYGNKKYSFLTPVLGVVFYIGFFLLTLHPEDSNFPVKITEDNQSIQFFIMMFFLKWLLLLVLLIFLNNQDHMFRYAFDENAKPKASFATMIMSIIGSLIVLFIVVNQFK
ncbi:DUF1648 domain-containing protein [Chryseobacterium daecheongense]|uniref:DUF1648 domain-containing protein n=1 Tax=Chryseobacterium daecheongense TaxID=192389 RepID=UPI001FD660D2|nr:DUF1648 domain-containing protein [Chryseobacterium daecheongense]UOU99732.1 DUF1648 domain-containing protein [Chryseobacterium daecheongense]